MLSDYQLWHGWVFPIKVTGNWLQLIVYNSSLYGNLTIKYDQYNNTIEQD